MDSNTIKLLLHTVNLLNLYSTQFSPGLYYKTNGSCVEKYVFGLSCTNGNSTGGYCSYISCALQNSHTYSCYSECYGGGEWISTLHIDNGFIELNNVNFSFINGRSNVAYRVNAPKNEHCVTQFLHAQSNSASFTRIGYHAFNLQTLQNSNFINNSNKYQGIVNAEFSITFYLKNCLFKDNNSTTSMLSVLYGSRANAIGVSFINNIPAQNYYHDHDSEIDSSQQGTVYKEIFINLPQFDAEIPKIYINTCQLHHYNYYNLNILLFAIIVDLS